MKMPDQTETGVLVMCRAGDKIIKQYLNFII